MHGAKRGPEPAHDIQIWLGAVKPRMLRLTGRKADGWLPSLLYFTLDELDRANHTIDEAAAGAGRDPREIRRLVNIQGAFAGTSQGFLQGPPEQWVEELLPFVLERGFSTFILWGDDPRSIERYGQEVAPALRAEVARERRAAGTAGGEVVRGPRALALRREGIDYGALPRSLGTKTVEPGDKAYPKVRSTYIRSGSPGLVIGPESAGDVVDALAFAREQEVPLSVRSGGHGISGRSTNDGGIVIDLGRLNEIAVLDAERGRIRLGPGARWGHVADALAPHGLAMSSGDYGDVGVGGLATAGGIGYLARKHGLTIDHVAAAELVLADGSRVRADAHDHPDLLWAIRGAGGNFGDRHRAGARGLPAGRRRLLDDGVRRRRHARAARALGRGDRGRAASADQLPLRLRPQGCAPERPRRQRLRRRRPRRRRRGAHAAARDRAAARPAGRAHPLPRDRPRLRQPARRQRGAAAGQQRARPAPHPRAERAARGRARHSGRAVARDPLGRRRRQRRRPGGHGLRPPAPELQRQLGPVGAGEAEFHRHWDGLRPHLDGLYISFETDERPERLHDAFPGATLDRLRELKAQYDPDNVFDANFPIPPAAPPRAVETAA